MMLRVGASMICTTCTSGSVSRLARMAPQFAEEDVESVSTRMTDETPSSSMALRAKLLEMVDLPVPPFSLPITTMVIVMFLSFVVLDLIEFILFCNILINYSSLFIASLYANTTHQLIKSTSDPNMNRFISIETLPPERVPGSQKQTCSGPLKHHRLTLPHSCFDTEYALGRI